jgi:hypothetical protein
MGGELQKEKKGGTGPAVSFVKDHMQTATGNGCETGRVEVGKTLIRSRSRVLEWIEEVRTGRLVSSGAGR